MRGWVENYSRIKKDDAVIVFFDSVEMAGIEPASERFDPRTSTSVVDLLFHLLFRDQQNKQRAIRSGPKALFRADHGKPRGTSAL